MTTTIERITTIIDEATADERAKVLDLERRLSNAYADLVSKKEALTDLKETVDLLSAGRLGLMEEVVKRDAQIAALEAQRKMANQQALAAENKLKREPSQEVADLADLAAKVQDLRDANARDAARLRSRIDRKERRIGGMIKELRRRDAVITDLNKQLDDAHAENARLVLRAADIEAREERNIVDMQATIRTLNARTGAAFLGAVDEAPTLRIDPDMSDPQPGKLLVARLSEKDARNMRDYPHRALDCVGFLVETPAVEVKEQGPWVVYDEGCTESDLKWRTAEGWFFRLVQPKCFGSREDAQEAIRDFGAGAKSFRIITLAEARAIEAQKTSG